MLDNNIYNMQLQMSENIIKTHVNRRNDSVNKWARIRIRVYSSFEFRLQ